MDHKIDDAIIPQHRQSNTDEASIDQENVPRGVGLPAHLRLIAENLLEISRTVDDAAQKDEYYGVISDRLAIDADRLTVMIESLNPDNPEGPPKITQEVDEEFAVAANYFLEAMDIMGEFMDTEQEPLIEQALESIKKGEHHLDAADRRCQELQEGSRGIRA